MPKVLQNCNQYIQKSNCGDVSFIYWIPVVRGSYEICITCPSLSPPAGQFNILKSSWLSSSEFFSLSYIILTSKNWWSLILAEYLFLLIFWQKVPQIGVVVLIWLFFFFFFWKYSLKENYCDIKEVYCSLKGQW